MRADISPVANGGRGARVVNIDKEQMEKVWKKILELQPQAGSGSLRIKELAEEMQAECGMRPFETGVCVDMLRKMKFVKVGYSEYAPNKMADDLIHVVEQKRDADIWSGDCRKILGSPRDSWLGEIFGEAGLFGIGWKK